MFLNYLNFNRKEIKVKVVEKLDLFFKYKLNLDLDVQLCFKVVFYLSKGDPISRKGENRWKS